MKTQCSHHSFINFKKQSGFPMEGTTSLDTAIGEGGLGHSAGQASAGHLLAAPLLRPPSTPAFRSPPLPPGFVR